MGLSSTSCLTVKLGPSKPQSFPAVIGSLLLLLTSSSCIVAPSESVLFPSSSGASQSALEYVKIVSVVWIPPRTYNITVEVRWFLHCLCFEHNITLEGPYALDWVEPQILKVIATWTFKDWPLDRPLIRSATCTVPREGTYKFIATASHGLKDEFVTFDFSLYNSGGITITRDYTGGSGSNTIMVWGSGTPPQSVTLSTSVPSEIAFAVVVSFNPSSGILPFTSTCTVTASASAPTGIYTMIVVGSGGGLTRTTSFTLTITSQSYLGTTRIVLDASPKPGYAGKPVTISGTMYGSWRRIKDGVVATAGVRITCWGNTHTDIVTGDHGEFSLTLPFCPSQGGTYTITATFFEDLDLFGTSATITYQIIAKIPTAITISYVGNREFAGYLRRQDTGGYLGYKPVKLTVTYLSGSTWQTVTYDLQTRQDGYYSLEFLFYWRTATIAFEGDETYASSQATITR